MGATALQNGEMVLFQDGPAPGSDLVGVASGFRDVGVNRYAPRREPTDPQPIPAVQLAHLRGLYQTYQAAVDATLFGMGFLRGGCAVNLHTGLVTPPPPSAGR